MININKFLKRGFSLAELMIVMLILTIILAATMPILSKRAKVKAAAAASAGGSGTVLYLYGTSFNLPNISFGYPVDYCNLEGRVNTSGMGGVCHILNPAPSYSYASSTWTSRLFPYYPPPCPSSSGWVDAGITSSMANDYSYNTLNGEYNREGNQLIRTCYNTGKTYTVIYFTGSSFNLPNTSFGYPVSFCTTEGLANTSAMGGVCHILNPAPSYSYASSTWTSRLFPYYPPGCPSGWTDAGLGHASSTLLIRTCYND